MGYYRGAGDCMYGRGDYYLGDYYRGDPGLGSFFKKVAGFVGKAIIPAPLRAAFDVGKSLLGGRHAFDAQGMALAPPPPVGYPVVPSPGFGGFVSRLLPGGSTGLELGAPPGVAVGPYCGIPGLARQPAGRWNKSTYVTRGGGTSRWPPGLQVHPKGTVCVKPRRMNVANPRALRRALRRASGFAKLASRYVRVSRKFKKGKKRKR